MCFLVTLNAHPSQDPLFGARHYATEILAAGPPRWHGPLSPFFQRSTNPSTRRDAASLDTLPRLTGACAGGIGSACSKGSKATDPPSVVATLLWREPPAESGRKLERPISNRSTAFHRSPSGNKPGVGVISGHDPFRDSAPWPRRCSAIASEGPHPTFRSKCADPANRL